MNVVCGACPAKYSIPDEKVRGRKVRIPCKHCGAAIIIDGTVLVADVGGAKAQSLRASPPNPSPTPGGTPGGLAAPPARAAVQATPGAAVARQRNIRQTIIGVAAPANAPDSSPEPPLPVRKPTPIYVRAPTAEAIAAAQSRTATSTSGQMRSVRRTMVGGLESEVAGAGEARPTPLNKARSVKHTNIGGLEAAVGSAPGASDQPMRPVPNQDTPPETWLAALPDGKTLRLPEKDLQRAITKGYVNMSTLFWQTGMDDWLPLEQLPQLTARLNPPAAGPRTAAAAKAPGAAAPVRPNPAKKAESPRPATAAIGRPNPAIPKPQLGRPAPVPSFSRQPTAARASVPVNAPAIPSVSTAPRPASNAPFATATPKVTRGPASVSARSSSPTLELVELESDDEIADILAAQGRGNGEDAQRVQELERLSAMAPSAANRNPPAEAPLDTISNAPQPLAAITAGDTGSNAKGSGSVVTVPRRRRSRAPVIVLVVGLVVACLVASYATRQPRPLYAFLHARGWEQAIDRSVQKVSAPVAAQIKKWTKH